MGRIGGQGRWQADAKGEKKGLESGAANSGRLAGGTDFKNRIRADNGNENRQEEIYGKNIHPLDLRQAN